MSARPKNIFEHIGRTWFTGVLYLLAAAGYVFYFLLYMVRMMQSRKKRFPFVPMIFIVSIALLVALVVFPFGNRGVEFKLDVDRGMRVATIAHRLKDAHVIRSETAFRILARLTKCDRHILSGRYTFYVNDDLLHAVRCLLHVEPIEVSVTIPDGLTIEQTASIFARTIHIDSLAFVNDCSDPKILAKHGVNARSAEGYLFPETYKFNPAASANDVIERMMTLADSVWSSVRDSANDAGGSLSRSEAITLASIVEKEAALRLEEPHISGVFHNRLKMHMPLGADPTVRYIFRKFTGPLYKSELANESPYNTRIHTGLPPAPICSPSRGALIAALRPVETHDVYFVAKWDGSGAHYFSVSYEEHLKKTQAARVANEKEKVIIHQDER